MSTLCLLISISLLGCGTNANMVPVTGMVSYKGKPLEYGSIMFQPVGVEGGKLARSKIASDGTFALWTEKEGDGVMVGTCQVRLAAFDAQRTNATGSKHQEMALGKSAIPKRFQNFGTSGISIEVAPDMELPIEIDLDDIE